MSSFGRKDTGVISLSKITDDNPTPFQKINNTGGMPFGAVG